MLISCLLPTFNRYPNNLQLLNEAIQCFLMQDYPTKELIICNDTPGQTLHIPRYLNHSNIFVYNLPHRFLTLGAKLNWMLQRCTGTYVCRWDDDDISLPWRLSYSRHQLGQWRHGEPFLDRLIPADNGKGASHRLRQEWRPEQHWLWQGTSKLAGRITQKSSHPGNTHIMAIWHRNILGGTTRYPGEECPSGLEDQTFNTQLRKRGYPHFGTDIPDDKIFYLYRWGSSPVHLSGPGGGDVMQETYKRLGHTIQPGEYEVSPQWYNDYTALAAAACTPELLPSP